MLLFDSLNKSETTSGIDEALPFNIFMAINIAPTIGPTINPIKAPNMDNIIIKTNPSIANTSLMFPPFSQKLKTNISYHLLIYIVSKYIMRHLSLTQ